VVASGAVVHHLRSRETQSTGDKKETPKKIQICASLWSSSASKLSWKTKSTGKN